MAEQTRRVDLNSADYETLSKLPMVGDKRAQFIIENRPYDNWEDIKRKVPGFSDGMIGDLKKGNATIGGKR